MQVNKINNEQANKKTNKPIGIAQEKRTLVGSDVRITRVDQGRRDGGGMSRESLEIAEEQVHLEFFFVRVCVCVCEQRKRPFPLSRDSRSSKSPPPR